MSPGIRQMNSRSWETLVLSMIKVFLLRTSGAIPQIEIKINSQKENKAIFNREVDEILLQENQKLSADKGAHENIESDFDCKEMYQIYNMCLEATKEIIELRKRLKLKNTYGIEIQNGMACIHYNEVNNIAE